jgi:LCP family protein required for cell wall assembly
MADTTQAPGPVPRRGRRRASRVVLVAGGAVLLLVLAVAGVFAARVAARRRPGEPVAQSIATAVLGPQPTNILLIGNNARDAASPLTPGQADLLFVVHIDPAQRQVVFISIPRNVMVALPRWRDPVPKIKGAFFMGGPALAMRAVSRLLGMPVRYYVVADFAGFVQAINDVGGLTIDVRQPIYDPSHSGAVFQPGVQHMDGAQVLAYVRVRQNEASTDYRVNDFQRMDAAFGVLAALRAQVFSHLGPQEVLRLLHLWRQDVATNLSGGTIAALALAALHARFAHVTVGSLADSMVLPSTALPGVNAEGAIEGSYYDIVTPAEIEAELAPYGSSHPYTGLPPLPAADTVTAEVGGGSAATVSALQAAGVHAVLGPLPASPGPTQVLYPSGELPAAEVVGRALGQGNEELVPAPVTTVEVEPGN